MEPVPLDRKNLIDIRTVDVNKNLAREERIAEFARQLKNPYLVKYKNYTVRLKYAKTGPTLEDCLRGMIN